MANTRTLTAANSIIMLSCDLLGLHKLQGFGADAVTETDAITQAETSMGVDGRLSGGFVPVAVPQGFTLQADSLSCDYMDNAAAQQETNREVLIFTGSLVLPATGQKYAMTRGFLTSYLKFPTASRTLQARVFRITWERVTRSPN